AADRKVGARLLPPAGGGERGVKLSICQSGKAQAQVEWPTQCRAGGHLSASSGRVPSVGASNPPQPVVPWQKERCPMQHEDKERAGWLRLSVPVPPRLAELIGYRGEARWVAVHWEPCGDESFYDDGPT